MTDTQIDYKTAKAIAKAKRPFYKKKRYWLLAFVAVVIIAMLAGAAGGGSDATATDDNDSSSSATAKASKPVAVTAADLIKQFEDNELQADAKYKGKTLKITGVVEQIDTEIFDEENYVLDLTGGGDFEILAVHVHDIPTEDLASINKGDKVTVTASFDDGGDLGVDVNDGILN